LGSNAQVQARYRSQRCALNKRSKHQVFGKDESGRKTIRQTNSGSFRWGGSDMRGKKDIIKRKPSLRVMTTITGGGRQIVGQKPRR